VIASAAMLTLLLLLSQSLSVDIHAHPSRFHRANVPRIEAEEIARYRRGGIDVVVCNISTDTPYRGGYVTREGRTVETGMLRAEPGESWAFTLDRLERIVQTAASGDAVLVRTPEEALEAERQGKLALIAALEGADGLEGDLEHLRELHRKGVALVQLVHFRANEIGHIQTWPYSPGGLTDFGRRVVAEANRLGIVIDLAHANPETIRDVLAVSSRPVIFSHTGSLTLKTLDRHLGDGDIRAIAEKGGVIGIWPNGEALPELQDMVDHIDYVRKLVGVDHVGIGSDLRGMSKYTAGFGEEARFDAIAEALQSRGYSQDEIEKVMGENFVRVWREATR
jgi:membrane dipeptidase